MDPKVILAAALLFTLTACATAPIPIGLPCTVGPVILDKGAAKRLTRSEKEQVLVINRTGAQLCRWQPPN
jgi:hypothetical protein